MCEEVEVLRLPDRLDYNDFHGDILAFIDAAYQIFRRDFITTRPLFDGKPLGLKKHPLIEIVNVHFIILPKKEKMKIIVSSALIVLNTFLSRVQ